MPELTGTNDLRSYLAVLWRWKWLLLAFLVVFPVIAYVVEHGKPKVYDSSALVGVNQTTVNTALLDNSSSFSTSNVTAIARIVTTSPVADVAAALMRPPANPSQIVGEVSATGNITTNFVTITAHDPSPARAAEIANAFAKAISKNLQQSAVGQIRSTISGLEAQLANLSPNDTTTRPALEQQLAQLKASIAAQGGEAAILQAATPSTTPAGLGTRRAVELGLLIGLLLGLGAVVLAEGADRRLRAPEDLEGITNLPLLAAIEPGAFGEVTEESKGEEAFQMLRSSLMYFNVDHPLDSVVITSAGEKDGKTTVATRLALASARAGLRVILVDADLRRAQVGTRLGIKAHDGFGAVIAGARNLSDVLVDYPLDEPGAGQLRVLPAGSAPPNPAALMSSHHVQRILGELESQSDLVIVDTPAALAVSDPLPLMGSVSGVVVVARMNRSTRQTIRRLQKILLAAHANLLGVVATGATAGPGYEGYYPNYYSHNGNGSHPSHRLPFPKRAAKPTISTEPGD
jgi:polysaccharide biosynthesis transport protein